MPIAYGQVKGRKYPPNWEGDPVLTAKSSKSQDEDSDDEEGESDGSKSVKRNQQTA